jgi:hypothetical protein
MATTAKSVKTVQFPSTKTVKFPSKKTVQFPVAKTEKINYHTINPHDMADEATRWICGDILTLLGLRKDVCMECKASGADKLQEGRELEIIQSIRTALDYFEKLIEEKYAAMTDEEVEAIQEAEWQRSTIGIHAKDEQEWENLALDEFWTLIAAMNKGMKVWNPLLTKEPDLFNAEQDNAHESWN